MAEFMGLHINLEKVWEWNNAKQGPNYVRKAGLLINMGDNPTKAQVYKKREHNKKKFGLPHGVVDKLRLPKAQTKEWLKVLTLDQILRNSTNFSSAEKIHHLKILEEALERKLNKITFLEKRNANNFKLCKLAVVV